MNQLLLTIFMCVAGGAGAGFAAGKVMLTEGRDLLMDTFMGVGGGLAGGFIAGGHGQRFYGNLFYTGLAVVMGAATLTVLSRLFGGRREYGS
jgi:hypothetical protein